MYTAPELAIVVVAAGRGSRVGGDTPKQYKTLAGRPLLAHTLDALMRAAPGATILPVIHSDDLAHYQNSAASCEASTGLAPPVFGGATRQASV
ncbi:MAG: IspD/TarI family cytidylyltransferase, partial [Methylocella sp.]